MDSTNDITTLFNKLIDQAISEGELARLSTHMLQADESPEMQQLLAEMWDYVGLLPEQDSDDLLENVDQILKKNQAFNQLRQAINEHKDRVAAEQEKIDDTRQQPPPAGKQRLWGWLKKIFAMGLITLATTSVTVERGAEGRVDECPIYDPLTPQAAVPGGKGALSTYNIWL
ncbi:hypothetical protein QQ020_35060 [Fulvivirgaceae bacterium BMA12]|uniref:Uncharacterized protein n=1 Tax=Agaribacillus aureus TaxID=3051825 RepID=A0ABT8LHS1_9BACT|nr:hypothetical protein [Fulvivirgaceae bacterium BMA12]